MVKAKSWLDEIKSVVDSARIVGMENTLQKGHENTVKIMTLSENLEKISLQYRRKYVELAEDIKSLESVGIMNVKRNIVENEFEVRGITSRLEVPKKLKELSEMKSSILSLSQEILTQGQK